MKNLSLTLNAVLIVAVAFLYYKVYSVKEEAPIPVVSGKAAESKIVFVNSDSLMNEYDLFKKIQESMERKRDSVDNLLTGRSKALERDIQEYQQKAETMSDFERQSKEENLGRRQQELLGMRDEILDKLKKQEDVLTDSIHNDLVGYLKTFNKNKGYDFILGYSRGGGILLASDSLDVTKKILEGLNSRK